MTHVLRILLAAGLFSTGAGAAARPNFVFILCDDLGYGDVKCLNPDGKIPTPHMDSIAEHGMRFTDAHSSSAVFQASRASSYNPVACRHSPMR